MKSLSNTLKGVLPFVIMLALISPFVIVESLFFPYITGKAFYFRIIVEIATLLYIVLATVNKEYRPRISPLTIGASIFVIILSLSTFFAIDPLKAFWSNYERMEGLVLFLHLFAFLIVAGSVIKKKDGWWTWFFNISLVMSIIIGVDAFLSFYSDPNHHGYRIFGNLGNSSYLGAYSLIHIFISIFFIIKKIGHRSVKALANQGSFVSIGFYSLVGLFNLIVLFNTGTRGSFVGLVAGIAVSSVLIAIFEKQNKAMRKTAVAFISISIAFVALLGIFKDSSFIKGNDMLGRFAELVTFDVKGVLENQGSARKMLWGMAWEGVQDRPVLGWGLDNFHYVFAEKYDPAMYAQEQWFDRSHNVFMDWLVSAGFLGLLSYLSLFALAIYMIWKISPQGMSFGCKAVLIGGFVAYLGHNLFVFDNLSSYILFFGVLAFIHDAYISDKDERNALANPHKSSGKREGAEILTVTIVSTLAFVLFCYVCYQVNLRPWSANATLLDGLRPQIVDAKGKTVTQTAEAKFAKIKESYEMNVLSNSESLEQLAEKGSELLASNASNEVKLAAFEYINNAFNQQFAKTPNDPRPAYFYVSLLMRSGMNDKAYEMIQRAVAISPKKQSFLTMKFVLEMQLQKNKEAAETAKTAYELEPRNEEAKRAYVASLILVNRAAEAEAFATTTAAKLAYLQDGFVLNAYVNSKQQARLIALFRKEIAANPNDVDLRTSLINVLIKLEDKASAIRELNILKGIEPSLGTQIDATIKTLQAK
jgi:O-antigen ligase